jgi:hypothetical protein
MEWKGFLRVALLQWGLHPLRISRQPLGIGLCHLLASCQHGGGRPTGVSHLANLALVVSTRVSHLANLSEVVWAGPGLLATANESVSDMFLFLPNRHRLYHPANFPAGCLLTPLRMDISSFEPFTGGVGGAGPAGNGERGEHRAAVGRGQRGELHSSAFRRGPRGDPLGSSRLSGLQPHTAIPRRG